MIDFIYTSEDYIKENEKLKKIFQYPVDFSINPFNKSFKTFLAFEFDEVYGEDFYYSIQNVLKWSDCKDFTFYTLEPCAKDYFFLNFSKYNIGVIPKDETYDNYIEFLTKDPGDSPADALLYNSETVAIFSDESRWGLLGSKYLELGVIGFADNSTKMKFVEFFDNDFFTDLDTRIKRIIDVLDLSDKSKLNYLKIRKNFSER